MRATYKFALVATAIGLATASPASAAVTLNTTNGTPLVWQIFGNTAVNDATTVFGSTSQGPGAPDNITYTGNTALHITNGFAQIQDADPAGDLFNIIIDPDDFFTQMKLSVQLESVSGSVSVYYLLKNSGLDPNAISSYTLLAGSFLSGQNDNQNYLIDGDAGEIFDGIMISTTDPISVFQVKQNSYTGAPGTPPPPPPPVPEPGTWALMVLGFGGIGMALRRSRKRNPALMQVA